MGENVPCQTIYNIVHKYDTPDFAGTESRTQAASGAARGGRGWAQPTQKLFELTQNF